MPNIFEYLDYRKFLSNLYEERKRENYRFSHRYLGQKGGFDPGLFSKVLSGERSISKDMIQRFMVAFDLEKRESKYFKTLVLFTQAEAHEEKKKYLEDLMAFNECQIEQIAADQYEYFEKWYYSAIRELLNYYEFTGDYSELGRMLVPAIKGSEARRAIQLLEKLNMVKAEENGRYVLTDSFVTSGFESQSTAVNNFILEGIDKAKDSLNIFTNEERNLSSLTISVDQAEYKNILEKIRKFRKEILTHVEKSKDPNRVFQLNLQLFPVSRKKPPVNRNRKSKND